jgi:hypothetical protein
MAMAVLLLRNGFACQENNGTIVPMFRHARPTPNTRLEICRKN